MPKTIVPEPLTHVAVNVTWVVGAVVFAYFLGVALSWLLQRVKGRRAIIDDIDVLTRGPVRATFMLLAAPNAIPHSSDSSAMWRGCAYHLLVIAVMGTTTWLVASVVLVAERGAIARFACGD